MNDKSLSIRRKQSRCRLKWTFAPLGNAMRGVVWALASLIQIIASAIPFLLFGCGMFWLVRWWWKGRKTKSAPTASKDP